VAFVNVFVKLFDSQYAVCNFNIDMAVEFGTQIRIVGDDVSICKGMTTIGNRNAVVQSFVFWIFVSCDDRFLAKFFGYCFEHLPSTIQGALMLSYPHGPCSMHETIVS
jgi:hypothetical protein